jgi:hypothetical protein
MTFRVGDDGCSIEGVWANDERRFRLNVGEILALEEKRECGIAAVYMRLSSFAWAEKDVRETIRLGLMGAGVDSKIARRLVDTHVVSGNYLLNAEVARSIIGAALAGRGDLGKAGAATEAPEATASPPPTSMEVARS